MKSGSLPYLHPVHITLSPEAVPLAQLVEHRTFNPRAVGSSPARDFGFFGSPLSVLTWPPTVIFEPPLGTGNMSAHTLTQNWELLHRFLKCPAQQKAFNTILDELLGGDLIWTGENSDGRNHFARIQSTSKEYTIWSRFIKRLLHELCVYGFAMYRLIRVPASANPVAPQFRGEPTKEQPEYVDVEVENGVKLIVSWDSVLLDWDIKSRGHSGSFLRTKDHGWNLLVLNEPIKTVDTSIVLNSCASHAYDASMNLSVLDRNYSYRDFLNSTVVVTTQESAEVAQANTAASSIPTGHLAPVLGSASSSRTTDEFIAQSKKKSNRMQRSWPFHGKSGLRRLRVQGRRPSDDGPKSRIRFHTTRWLSKTETDTSR
jgi:hypothetical protein